MEPSTHGNGRSLQPVQPGMGPGRPAQAFGAPSTRARLIAAFAVVVLGLLLVEGAVVLSVHPQLSALHTQPCERHAPTPLPGAPVSARLDLSSRDPITRNEASHGAILKHP